ncbi:basic proline-rich protein-like [Balaenoptera acutorostrata]|uniref:Basic proline-rich protein-like n=1 Tax=Balaenoptera acutorostrata TaxID=9767 RepID=A0ABM3SIL1_BALAC|nr:basic proline-rich protein-like [Balaenoptera acutorostrata]
MGNQRAPALRRSPRNLPWPDCASGLSGAGKSCSSGPGPAGKVRAADRQPRGGVRAASLDSPGGPRDPQAAVPPMTAPRASGSGSRRQPDLPGSGGPRERPSPFLPRVRGVPAAPPVSGTSQEAPPGFRPVSQRSQSPASSTADGQGAGADGPEPCGPTRSGAPRARPVASPGRGPPPTHYPLSPPACARQRPLAPAPHLRRAPAPSSPPEPAVYTGSDVSGPAPPPPQADAGWLQTKRLGADPNHSLRERGGDGPAPPCLGTEDLQMGQPGWGLRTGGQSPQGHPGSPL